MSNESDETIEVQHDRITTRKRNDMGKSAYGTI